MTKISRETLMDHPPTLWERFVMWARGQEIVPVNEHQCPGCGKWDHEISSQYFPTNPNQKYGHLEYDKLCDCGYVTHWVDTGFMGVLGCVDDPKPLWKSFPHRLPRR